MRMRGVLESSHGKMRDGENSSSEILPRSREPQRTAPAPGWGEAEKSGQKFRQVHISKQRAKKQPEPGNCVWGMVDACPLGVFRLLKKGG